MTPAMWDWPAHYARTQPGAFALRNLETGETRSWDQLHRRVGQIVHTLRHVLGLPPGSRIANLSSGDLRHFELQFACIRAGMVWVPLNFRQTATELSTLCRNLKPSLMLTDSAWHDVAQDVATAAAIPNCLVWGPGQPFDALVEAAPIAEPAGSTIDPDAPMQVLFTSGTTGEPKAVVYTLTTLTWHIINQMEFCATQDATNHVFVPIPLFHAGGLHSTAYPSLFAGGQVTVSVRFDPEQTVRFIGTPANRVTHMSLVPVMFQMMADTDAFAAADFSNMRCMLCAGGRMTDKLRDIYAAKGVAFVTQYGGTETGPTVTSLNPARLDKLAAGSCGQKARFVDIRIVDEAGQDMQQGQAGELWVRGPCVTIGYLGKDGALIPTGDWLKTGDVAQCDDEGFYYIVDRVKDMYKSGGENVFPAEVEHILLEHPAVLEVGVIGVADARWGEVGSAIVVVRPGAALTLESLRAHCDGRLARFKQPQHLVVVDALPRNVTGKLSKTDLRLLYGGSKGA